VKKAKLFGIIALLAIIVLGVAGCDNGTPDGISLSAWYIFRSAPVGYGSQTILLATVERSKPNDTKYLIVTCTNTAAFFVERESFDSPTPFAGDKRTLRIGLRSGLSEGTYTAIFTVYLIETYSSTINKALDSKSFNVSFTVIPLDP
jgi:hypothetical protein